MPSARNRRDSIRQSRGSIQGAMARPIATPIKSVMASPTSPSRPIAGRFWTTSVIDAAARPPSATQAYRHLDVLVRSQSTVKTTKIPQWTTLSRFGTWNHERVPLDLLDDEPGHPA